MNTKNIKLIALFAVICISFSCKNSDDESNIDMSKINFSNIEDLHAQPLPVIQKCVEGKWKWYRTYQSGYLGILLPTNSVVYIYEDSVVIIGDDGINSTFFYNWGKKKTSSNYTTYCMLNRKPNGYEWFFDEWYFSEIKNDSLTVINFTDDFMLNTEHLFVRIK